MRPLRAVLIYIAAILLCGALVAPWLYHIAQSVSETFPALAQQPFHRFVSRTMLATALVGLWPFLRATGLASASALGLVGHPHQIRWLSTGFLVGVGTVMLVAVCVLATGARKLDPGLAGTGWLGKLAGITATAVVVGMLEEVLFRGALFGALRRVWHWAFALVVSSVLFASAHLIQGARVEGTVGWLTGFVVLGRMFEGFCYWHRLMPTFINLTLVGVVLCIGYHRTRSLHFPIGLHAGWVFALKIYGWLTAKAEQANTVFWGTHKFIDGWLAFFVLVVLCVILLRVLRHRAHKSPYAQIVF